MYAIKFRRLVFLLMIVYASSVQGQNNLSQLNEKLASDFITKDSSFRLPYVDIDEWREKPVHHRYVHGGFRGTETRFSFYFPPKEKYQRRFFQYHTPFPDNENLAQFESAEEDKIGFSIASGAYFIETNGGGKTDLGKPSVNADPTIGAYRANANCAQFSRVVAIQIFGGKRPYGYAFGGSGGAYRTVGGIENTEGVWDGVVPFVLGSPMAIPNVFTARMYAMQILHDKLPQIIDAVEPGGSGNMYAGLNAEEKAALEEVTRMGFPPQSWYAYKTMGIHGFIALYQGVVAVDKKYFTEDFWNTAGYLGSNPPASLLKSRIQVSGKIKAAISIDQAVTDGLTAPMPAQERGSADLAWKSIGGHEGTMPVAFQLENILPEVYFLGGDLIIKSGAAAGKTLQIASIVADKVLLGPADKAVLLLIHPGDEVQVDNSNFLAVQTYHRHQVPASAKEYPEWDQFRDAEGKPIYPQRRMLLGPMFTRAASGLIPNGKFKGKMILLESLWDREAFPWQADWYRSKVKDNLGDSTDSHFRLWYTDHATHGDGTGVEEKTHTVSYLAVLHQALRDLSAWVEKGIEPPANTSYKIEDGQVIIPPAAEERKGIQPVISLTVDGGKKIEIATGKTVTFNAVVEVPETTGKIVSAQWDFEQKGEFNEPATLVFSDKTHSRVTLKGTHVFNKPGIYFVAIKAFSQRTGDQKDRYTQIPNLDRVRVVVQ